MSEVVVVGSANVDLTLNVEHLPRAGETILTDWRGVTRGCGGKGANQAVAAARLGATTALIGRVGNDDDADFLTRNLSAAGVDVSGLTRDRGATGLAVVLVDSDAENSIVVSPGANATLSPQHLVRHAGILAAAAVVLLSMEVPMETLENAAQCSGHLVVLNPAPFAPLSRGLRERVDVLVPNRGELAAALGVSVSTTIAEAVEQARAAPWGRIVVTLGADGALVLDHGRVEHLPAPAIQAVDTVGAGDAFCAALSVGLARGMTLADAARKAVAAGAVAVGSAGAQAALPLFAEL